MLVRYSINELRGRKKATNLIETPKLQTNWFLILITGF